jgi:hypothetical protein
MLNLFQHLISVQIRFGIKRKVRTQREIAGNTVGSLSGLGQVQQKVCTGNAVVKVNSMVKYQVYQHLGVSFVAEG